jgi:hypothetical protein
MPVGNQAIITAAVKNEFNETPEAKTQFITVEHGTYWYISG